MVEEKRSCDGCSRGARKNRERVREQMVGMGIRRGRSYEGKGKAVENVEMEVQRHIDGPETLGTRSEDRYDGREHRHSSSHDVPAGWCDLGLEM